MEDKSSRKRRGEVGTEDGRRGKRGSRARTISTGDGIGLEDHNAASNEDLQALWTIPDSLHTLKEFYEHFKLIATYVLDHVAIVAGGTELCIREIEFYLWRPPDLNDPFTHRQELQGVPGLFFFHRTGKSYRGGTYKGLDISIGDDVKGKGRGGILIRTLEDVEKKVVINGPCNCVNHILALTESSSIIQLVDEKLAGDITVNKTSSNKCLYLRGRVSFEQFLDQMQRQAVDNIFSSPRVGLHLTKAGCPLPVQTRFVYLPFRFMRNPKLIPKGRHLLILWLFVESKCSMNAMEIAARTGYSVKVVGKVLSDFHAGKSAKIERFVGRPLGDKEVSMNLAVLFHAGSLML